MSDAPKTVSLVLGSGGARGYAHAGVIRYLEEQGYQIKAISGCSMGSLIGGIYATGKLEEFIEWVTELRKRDIVRLMDPVLGWRGLFKGERVIDAMKDLIGDHHIEDLPLRFTAVATDIDAQEEVWIDEGPLFDAIRASISIPTVFTPAAQVGRRLVDGGLMNPLPIEPTLDDKTDLTIAVSLNGHQALSNPDARSETEEDPDLEPEEESNPGRRARIKAFVESVQDRFKNDSTTSIAYRGPFEVVSRSIETMQNTITGLKLVKNPPDVLIEVPRETAAFFEFHRAREMIELGYQLAANTLAAD